MHSSLLKFTLALICPHLENGSLQAPTRYIGDFSVFNVFSSSKNCPSARCTSVLMLLVGKLTHLEQKLFLFIVFYNSTFLIIKILTVLNINICIYVFFSSPHNGWRDSTN
jgi:hypothetical protein